MAILRKLKVLNTYYMRKIKGKTVVDLLKKQVFTIDLKDFDAEEYLNNLKSS